MRSRFWTVILWLLVILSLGLNLYLISLLVQINANVRGFLSSAQTAIETSIGESFTTYVAVDYEIPIETVVPISQTISVPLDLDYPLSTVVHTYVHLPLLGRQNLAIPIETIIPIHDTFSIPIEVEFPISLTYRLQADLPISVTIPPEIRDALLMTLQEVDESLK